MVFIISNIITLCCVCIIVQVANSVSQTKKTKELSSFLGICLLLLQHRHQRLGIRQQFIWIQSLATGIPMTTDRCGTVSPSHQDSPLQPLTSFPPEKPADPVYPNPHIPLWCTDNPKTETEETNFRQAVRPGQPSSRSLHPWTNKYLRDLWTTVVFNSNNPRNLVSTQDLRAAADSNRNNRHDLVVTLIMCNGNRP